MRTLNMQDLLKQYKIDVEFIEDFLDNDPIEIQEAFYKRAEILKHFNDLTLKELKEFLNAEKVLEKHLSQIKQKYPLLYEKTIEPQNELLKTKLIDIFITS